MIEIMLGGWRLFQFFCMRGGGKNHPEIEDGSTQLFDLFFFLRR
jgi:hypothetical protein